MKLYINIGEKWKPLIYRDIKPIYSISDYGLVKNNNTGKIVSINLSEKGYPMVSLMTTTIGKQKTYKLHRLVAYCFLEIPDFTDGKNWTVNHKDGNKENNHVSNLEWITFSDNLKHAFKLGLNRARKGSLNGNNKYDEKLIHLICKLMEDGFTNREIKKILKKENNIGDINRYLMYDLRHKNTWSHITQLYQY